MVLIIVAIAAGVYPAIRAMKALPAGGNPQRISVDCAVNSRKPACGSFSANGRIFAFSLAFSLAATYNEVAAKAPLAGHGD
ncbi:MAG: hypothetical protein R2912_06055 [Eubacteriales bacterium]